MATKKQIRIPIKVDGKEILLTQKQVKKLAQETTKAASGFDAMNTSQRGADRAGKGLSRQSSNSTKNFSKMQQGISGGLVPAYATLAAQVFAVSAAFQFLKSSVNFKNLIEGQKAFGSVTGVAFGTITNAVRKATNGQLAYQDAAQAVAIGTASGLGRSQMEALGKAARDTSLALGRDLSDSFNRLVRGVTKAEPELLDELGIILRLDPALKAYATSINKTKEELNAFERTQAIFNEVAGQAEEKFGRITEIMDPQAFALAQFATAFDDLLNKLKSGLGSIAQTVLPFFTNNIYALIAALALFAIPIIKTILPSFDAMEKNAALRLKGTRAALEETEKSMIDLSIAQKAADASPEQLKQMERSGQSGAKRILKKAGVDTKGKDLTQSQVAAYKRSMRTKTGIYKKFNKQERIAFTAHLKKLDSAHKASNNKRQLTEQINANKSEARFRKTEVVYRKTQIMMARATTIAASAMNKAMMAMGIIGIITLLVSGVMAAVNFFRTVDTDAKAAKERMEDLTSSTRNLNIELQRMLDVRSDGLINAGQFASQTANMVGSSSAQKLASDFAISAQGQVKTHTDYGKIKTIGTKEFEANAKATGATFKKLEDAAVGDLKKAYAEIGKKIRMGNAPTIEMIKNLAKLEGEFMGLATAAKQATEVQKSFDQALRGAVGPKRQFQSLRQTSEALVENIEKRIKLLKVDKATAAQANEGGKLTENQVKKFKELNTELEDQLHTAQDLDGALQNILVMEDQILAAKRQQKRELLAISPINSDANKEARAMIGINNKILTHADQLLKVKIAEAQMNAAKTSQEKADAKFNLDLQNDLLSTTEAQIAAEIEKVGLQIQQIKNATILAKLGMESTLFGNNVKLINQGMSTSNPGLAGTNALSMATKAASVDARIDEERAKLQQKINQLADKKLTLDAHQIRQVNKQIEQEEELSAFRIKKIEQDRLVDQIYNSAKASGIKGIESAGTSNIMGAIKGEKSGEEALKATALAVAEAILQSLISSIISSLIAAIGITSPAIVAAHGAGGMEAGILIMAAHEFGGGIAAGLIAAAMSAGATATAVASGGGIVARYGNNPIPSLAGGGVVSGPNAGYNSILHGTEAVIPLGQGQDSIPVDLKGTNAPVTNSVVNVTVNSDGSSTMDDSQASAFGKGIQAAIRGEIAKQKRSGGLLSPNG
tara:strand:+ start:892 stop:4428 length:3537 start_codon:yes stop_codon:yes gene_type:complete